MSCCKKNSKKNTATNIFIYITLLLTFFLSLVVFSAFISYSLTLCILYMLVALCYHFFVYILIVNFLLICFVFIKTIYKNILICICLPLAKNMFFILSVRTSLFEFSCFLLYIKYIIIEKMHLLYIHKIHVQKM